MAGVLLFCGMFWLGVRGGGLAVWHKELQPRGCQQQRGAGGRGVVLCGWMTEEGVADKKGGAKLCDAVWVVVAVGQSHF